MVDHSLFLPSFHFIWNNHWEAIQGKLFLFNNLFMYTCLSVSIIISGIKSNLLLLMFLSTKQSAPIACQVVKFWLHIGIYIYISKDPTNQEIWSDLCWARVQQMTRKLKKELMIKLLWTSLCLQINSIWPSHTLKPYDVNRIIIVLQ